MKKLKMSKTTNEEIETTNEEIEDIENHKKRNWKINNEKMETTNEIIENLEITILKNHKWRIINIFNAVC